MRRGGPRGHPPAAPSRLPLAPHRRRRQPLPGGAWSPARQPPRIDIVPPWTSVVYDESRTSTIDRLVRQFTRRPARGHRGGQAAARPFFEAGPKWPVTGYVRETLGDRPFVAHASIHPWVGDHPAVTPARLRVREAARAGCTPPRRRLRRHGPSNRSSIPRNVPPWPSRGPASRGGGPAPPSSPAPAAEPAVPAPAAPPSAALRGRWEYGGGGDVRADRIPGRRCSSSIPDPRAIQASTPSSRSRCWPGCARGAGLTRVGPRCALCTLRKAIDRFVTRMDRIAEQRRGPAVSTLPCRKAAAPPATCAAPAARPASGAARARLRRDSSG